MHRPKAKFLFNDWRTQQEQLLLHFGQKLHSFSRHSAFFLRFFAYSAKIKTKNLNHWNIKVGVVKTAKSDKKPLSVITQLRPLNAYLFFKNIKLQAPKFNTLLERTRTHANWSLSKSEFRIWIEIWYVKRGGAWTFILEQWINLESYNVMTALCTCNSLQQFFP